MSADQSWDVERRAEVHAALGESTRLRIVDHLSLGDATPSELSALLAMPSNLLAHHLRILGDAGLVARHRSEADRRRSYLRLLPDALDGLLPNRAVGVRRVLFVCTGNSARSQLAAALWTRASLVPVASAGTHPAAAIAPGARRTARTHRLPLLDAAPRQLADVLQTTDLIVTVCDSAHEELDPGMVPIHWSVPDPVRVGTPEAFDAAYDELASRVARLAPRLTPVAS